MMKLGNSASAMGMSWSTIWGQSVHLCIKLNPCSVPVVDRRNATDGAAAAAVKVKIVPREVPITHM